jgi:hypothetical protein
VTQIRVKYYDELKGRIKFSKEFKQLVLNKSKGKCACCNGKLDNKYHTDHIIPLSNNGTYLAPPSRAPAAKIAGTRPGELGQLPPAPDKITRAVCFKPSGMYSLLQQHLSGSRDGAIS